MGHCQSKGENELIEACNKRDVTRVKKLIKNGVNVNTTIVYTYPLLFEGKRRSYIQDTVLSCSLKNCNEEIAEVLIKNGADIKFMEKRGHESSLFLAVKYCYSDTVKLLIEYGANIDENVHWQQL